MAPARASRPTCASAWRRGWSARIPSRSSHAETIRNLGGPSLNHPIPWGLELALWDVVGKAAGQPLYRLWGGYTDRIKAYASCCEVRSGAARAEDALAFASGAIAVELRLHAWTVRMVAQVEAVRRAVSDTMEIMVDANQAQTPGTPHLTEGPVWSYERALRTCRALADLDVTWVEEPLGQLAFDDLARLAAASDVPIIAGGAEQCRLARVPPADRAQLLRRHPGRRRLLRGCSSSRRSPATPRCTASSSSATTAAAASASPRIYSSAHRSRTRRGSSCCRSRPR